MDNLRIGSPKLNNAKIRFSFLFVLFFTLSFSQLAFSQAQPPENPDGGEEQAAPAEEGGGDAAPDAAVLAKGEELWSNNCTSCHGLGEEVVVGPGLKGILERRSREWLIPWIKNSQKMIKQDKDPYAVALYNKYNQNVMTSFPWPDEDINAVITYVDYASKQAPDPTPGEGGGVVTNAENDGGGLSSNYFNLLLGILVFVLVLILAVLLLMISILRKFLEQKEDISEEDKEVINQPAPNYGAFFRNPIVLNSVALIFGLVILKGTLDGLTDIGIQQGYAPRQPIAFSHKLHAGMYNIDCNYCHTGVNRGKSAVIPSANICMNCHNAIKRGSPEIQKIYKAVEEDKPIEWVRVHNLPDLAYFNHAQHVNVAGLECENCHGEIKEMEVVQQRAPLTMGWCINCHRETVVDHAKNNEYYDNLLEYHGENSNKPMTVENIGGLECSKCHY